ncbi:MarR family winged helix-turn-helix transcriptional regulator [Saccharothrix sp. Mg75]|uniref:MarR family winged helix-turn-helix transcriptional regulator n=1 Tax=Saccharothrix sp. Mg75 TaxID=3445357 RepID=UPI003EEEC973
MTEVDPLTFDWPADRVEVVHRLRDLVVGLEGLTRHLATWLRLPVSDANALSHVIWAAEAGAPLSPARLSRRIGMTSGSTTVLLNRLETAGHVHRSRESADRRRVTLRPDPAARERVRGFLAFAGTEVAATLRAADPDELRVVIAFLAGLTEAAGRANERLARDAAGGREGRTGVG